jgi:hypothetical protein
MVRIALRKVRRPCIQIGGSVYAHNGERYIHNRLGTDKRGMRDTDELLAGEPVIADATDIIPTGGRVDGGDRTFKECFDSTFGQRATRGESLMSKVGAL